MKKVSVYIYFQRSTLMLPTQGRALTRLGHDRGYVTHGDLLNLAINKRCAGIHVEPVISLCRPDKNFWIFKATVYKSAKCRGFVGYGDAYPGNVSPLIFNHDEMRMAETRAFNRTLRKAYGIALCSSEELPPWALTQEQIPQLRRALQSRPPFQKGVPMRMEIQGRNRPREGVPLVEGLHRAQVVRFEPASHVARPCRAATFLVLEPAPYACRHVRIRLYCHDRALWKLRWFLGDFGYL